MQVVDFPKFCRLLLSLLKPGITGAHEVTIGKGLSYQTVHNPRLEHSARLVQFLSPVVDRILAVQDLGCRLSLWPETIDSTNGLALFLEDPKLLHDYDVVHCNEI